MKQTFKPILFNTEMVQAILQGRKTQTRRTRNLNKVNQDPDNFTFESFSVDYNYMSFNNLKTGFWQGITNAIGVPGDILWVRETFSTQDFNRPYIYKANQFDKNDPFDYSIIKWKPSIHMPKEACRIFLEITEIRVERLQEISNKDCINEGIKRETFPPTGEQCFYFYPCKDLRDDSYLDCPKTSFYSLWKSINGQKSWESNPWVWAISFERISKPEGFNEC